MSQQTPETDADVSDSALSADDITKTYGSRVPLTRSVEVLTGASIDVRPKEIVGIIGENGSGKSTLMKILVGVLEKDDGTGYGLEDEEINEAKCVRLRGYRRVLSSWRSTHSSYGE
ncbi:ATP-binding cassette domain-containing protein [Natronolimnohabitans sp. A-GB9]|uniref:ATP-binding cassette domain-containing protein n=1 Tax=Natronolimnohabitans sp. A-GB9 TaxID=3069757 RepID=UPI0027B7FC6E|nr:ATP-binding cassette domain-containing protein [Natronolimnohabitans sp. A-GB9]MDQ2051708.1 ATP-binding cassette domain-containing protein [Natronolimnohabitans sp. A-GB9]